jgi:uncharacterized membrane protein YhaH (DUF805 family)
VDGFATSVAPIRRFAEFGGRSTRTELLLFYVLLVLLGVIVAFFAPSPDALFWMQLAIAMLTACPTVALATRRLHDVGRSGWWLLLALPAFVAGLWQSGWRFPPTGLPRPLPPAIEAGVIACDLVLIALLLWRDEAGTNRFGPNPRYDDGGPRE